LMKTSLVRRALVVTALCCGLTAPLAATVYVPVLDGAVRPDGSRVETELWISSSLDTASSFAATELAASGALVKSANLQVPARGSLALRPAAASGDRLLALELAAGVRATANLLTTSASGVVAATPLPVIEARDRFEASAAAAIAAGRNAGAFTGLGAVNLGEASARCEARFVNRDGAALGSTLSFEVPAHSLVYRRDALAATGASGALGATMSCDQPFFPFAGVERPATTSSSFVTPWTKDGEPIACTAGNVCYDYPGVVHVSTTKTPARGFIFDPPDGRYDRLTVHLEVKINGWSPPLAGAHGILYLIRDKNKDMFANVFLQGPVSKGNNLVFRHGFNQTHPQKAKIRVKFAPTDGKTYSFDYVYDTAAKTLVLTVKGPNGQELMRLQDKPNIANIDFSASQHINLGLSNPGKVSNEPASIGWSYENLHVELKPHVQ
ncbi:MAG TPA: hypothetical protein VN923_09155, partial [Thermoanaerobaculia bacterium]|nr:hypothetical protein [Thermoanaerobaculia bacterium]